MVAIGTPIEAFAAGTNNAGAIYFGVNTASATSPTAAIEASWGGAADPQIHIGVCREGAATRYSAFYDKSLRLYTDNSERMRINSSGNVGIGTSSPNQAAKLEVSSTTQGFLPPQMTEAQRNAITTPPSGLILYNTTVNKLQVRTNTAWEDLH
jgi:hypothetical protein